MEVALACAMHDYKCPEPLTCEYYGYAPMATTGRAMAPWEPGYKANSELQHQAQTRFGPKNPCNSAKKTILECGLPAQCRYHGAAQGSGVCNEANMNLPQVATATTKKTADEMETECLHHGAEFGMPECHCEAAKRATME